MQSIKRIIQSRALQLKTNITIVDMKKFFILCLMAFVMCSCGVSYSYMGNVTLLTDNGNEIEKWENATLAQGDSYNGTYNTPYKNSGVEITTAQGETIYVNGGIIIVRNIEKVFNNSTSTENNKEKLILQYKSLSNELGELKNRLKLYDKNSTQYQDTKIQISICKNKLSNIESAFWDVSDVHISEYL